MKKLWTSAVIALATAAIFPAAAQDITFNDYAGGYVCTAVEGIEGSYDYDYAEAWVGHKMNITVGESGWDEGKTELTFNKFFPQGYYNNQGVYVRMDDPTTRSAYVISKRSYVGQWSTRKLIYSSDPNGADLDIDCACMDYDAGTPDGRADIVVTWSEDLNSFTVENLIATPVDGEGDFKAAKIVYEKSMTPAEPSLRASFNLATGATDVTITLPSTYDYDSGYAQITNNFDKVVLERSIDWGATWTTLNEWAENDGAALAPGAELSYSDTDLNFDDPDHTWYNYRVTVYLGISSSNTSNGTVIGASAPRVQNLTATIGEKGALPVTLTFNLPTEESLIYPLTKVEVSRYDYDTWSDVLLATYTEDLTPERLITFVDENAAEGNNTYRVYTYWKYGRGQDDVKAFVGLDTPGAVVNFQAKPESQKKVTLTWEAPVKGQQGGYIDPEATLYKLTRRLSDDWGTWEYDEATGNWECIYSSLTVLGEDMTQTTYTDELDEVPDGLYQYTYELYTYVAGQDNYGYGGSLVACFGPDQPGTPINLQAQAEGNNVSLTWEIPSVGSRGGYFDPEEVLYKVTRRRTNDIYVYDYETYTGAYPTLVTVAEDLTEASVIDKLDVTTADSYFYEVYAYTKGNESNNSACIEVIAGPKNGVGFKEGFDNKNAWDEAESENLWTISGNVECEPNNYVYYNTSDTYHDYSDENGNNQFLIFKNYEKDYWWAQKGYADATPYNFDLTDTDMPVVLYRVLMLPTENNGKLSICGGTLDEGQSLSDLTVFATETNYDADFELVDNEPTWRDCIAVLPELAGASDCIINFHYETGELCNQRSFFAIDDIELRDYKAPVVTAKSVFSEAEKQHQLTWTDPSTDDLLVEYFEIYRSKTQKLVNSNDSQEFEVLYPEEEIGNELELIATLADADYATEYVDNMISEDGSTYDATAHIYVIVAVYSDPVEIKSSSKPIKVKLDGTDAIGSISTDNDGLTRYYNLQGQRIASPAKGQIVIEVKGGKAAKIIR